MDIVYGYDKVALATTHPEADESRPQPHALLPEDPFWHHAPISSAVFPWGSPSTCMHFSFRPFATFLSSVYHINDLSVFLGYFKACLNAFL